MNLGILLPLGDSLRKSHLHGQDSRFVKYYLNHYCGKFDQVYLFSYENETYSGLPKNCKLVCPPFPMHRFVYGLLLSFLQIKKYQQCDVFRCFHPSAAVPGVIGKIFFRKKFIFNYNYDYQALAKLEGKSYLLPFLSFWQWLAFKFCDEVFVADEKMQQHVSQKISLQKVTLVRNGADTKSFKPLNLKRKSKENLVLTVGRLDPVKNYGQLIEAVSQLKIKTNLLIVGRGLLKEQLQSQATDRGVKLEIVDVIPHEKLPLIYNQASVYVQCSLSEAPVKTLLEAMSCGRPCVGTNVVGIRDVITDNFNGLLADLGASNIKDKIETILKNSKLAQKLGKNARKTILEKYDLQAALNLETDRLLNL